MLDALQSRAPAVVLTPDYQQAYLVTIYTPHDLLWARGFVIAHLPIERLKDTLYLYAYLNTDARDQFASYFTRLSAVGGPSFYRELYEVIEGYESGFDYQELFLESGA